ncbi:MAG: TIGR00282 family metallophosphoesterase [Firmicutes bacterium]|nr:TIGR00282 family metallophosphoesterase [Bacillota bacterium]MDY2719879.1 TIGR00282 family metallophosphoesterase [Candidatus Faecousia sp.]
MEFRVLAVGDVCAASGVAYLGQKLRGLKKLYGVDFCVVNGENACVVGITPRQAEEIFDAGADVITLGNHAFHRREIADYLDDNPYILRPANLSPLYSGKGLGVYDTRAGAVAVINLIGRCNMDFGPDNPFLLAEKLLRQVQTRLILVDFHAEATSEKLAFGYWADGRVSAVWGTHTHVPTADEMILPKGTGYVTDLGMTGPAVSVLGVRPEQSISLFRGGPRSRFEPAPGPCKLEAALFTLDTATGLCTGVERVMIHD